MRTDIGDGNPTHTRLDELLNALIVIRWDLYHALDDAADDPVILTNHTKKVGDELDAAIAALKGLLTEQGRTQDSEQVYQQGARSPTGRYTDSA